MLKQMLTKAETYRKILLVYWGATSVALCCYLYLVALDLGKSLPTTLKVMPNLALVTLVAGLNFVLAVGLWKLAAKDRTLFLSFALVQQLLSLNFVGALLIYFYHRFSQTKLFPRPTNQQLGLLVALILLLVVTLFALVVRIRLAFLG